MIEDNSKATNQQSPVTEADRRANDKVQIELQEKIYEEFGLYYERKRGEFGDGLHHGYITRDEIIDRELFLKVCLAAQWHIATATISKVDILVSWNFKHIVNVFRIRDYNSINLRCGYSQLVYTFT